MSEFYKDKHMDNFKKIAFVAGMEDHLKEKGFKEKHPYATSAIINAAMAAPAGLLVAGMTGNPLPAITAPLVSGGIGAAEELMAREVSPDLTENHPYGSRVLWGLLGEDPLSGLLRGAVFKNWKRNQSQREDNKREYDKRKDKK